MILIVLKNRPSRHVLVAFYLRRNGASGLNPMPIIHDCRTASSDVFGGKKTRNQAVGKGVKNKGNFT